MVRVEVKLLNDEIVAAVHERGQQRHHAVADPVGHVQHSLVEGARVHAPTSLSPSATDKLVLRSVR